MALTKVSSSLVSDSAVTSGKIADGGVATADIATNAVTSTKIAQNSILTKHIDDGQVTTDQLGADAVTAAKIADDAISEEHLDITVITSLTAVTAATGDLLMVADVSDSNNLKKIPVSSILAGTLTNAAQTNITSLGTLTALTVDDITINGSTISDAGDLTLDAAGGINLDSDGGEISFKDAGTEIGKIFNSSSNFAFEAGVQDKDIIFKGNDNGSAITALTLDMSAAGAATFNSTINSGAITSTTGVDVSGTDELRYRMLNNGTFKAGIEVATTNGDMIGTSAVNDFAIRSQANMLFSTGGNTERMRIDSSGSLLVGNTDTTPYDRTSGNAIALGDGLISSAQSGGNAAIFNRMTSDGSIVGFRKGGTAIGSIGVEGGDSLFIQGGTSSGAGLLCHGGAAKILPVRNSASIDATIDLGQGSRRFKDLYLAGAITTGTINNFKLLDLGSASMLITHTDRGTGTISSATHNTGFGYAAFNALTSGDYNVALGVEALAANLGGSRNIAIGTYSLSSNQTGNYNTACGYGTLNLNTASNNTAVGYEVMLDTVGGANNTGLGYRALTNNTSGHSNVAVGTNALLTAQTRNGNVAVGFQAAQDIDTSGVVAIGFQALMNSGSGYDTVAIGTNAMYSNSSGNSNVAVGFNALYANQNGNQNVAVGNGALDTLQSGSSNVGIGRAAGTNVLDGLYNVIVGADSGGSVTSGAKNTIVGWAAGSTLQTGTDNVCIGRGTRTSATNSDNQIVMGDSVTSAGNNTFTIGKDGTDSAIAFGANSVTAPSDVRLKEDIQDEEVGLDFINDLRPVTFLWKKEKDIPSEMNAYKEGSEERTMNGKYNHGFIAQEVKATIDSHDLKEGFDMWQEDDSDGRQRVAPSAIMSVMVKAVQELSAKVQELEEKLNGNNKSNK